MDGNVQLEGYMVFNGAASGTRPGVLVVHQWGGLGAYEKGRADLLAEMGYVAFAVDIYGKGVRPTLVPAKQAESTKYKSDRALFRSRLMAGYKTLLSEKKVDSTKTAAIGYCFGGTGVLELARAGAPVRGVVSFHGGLDSPTPADGRNIRAKVLILHGADDPFVPQTDIDSFVKEMRDARVDWQMVSYGGAVHSFTEREAGNDPSRGAAYNANADRRSWEAMKAFFAEIFR
jgi:dienelactone hydrolase